MGASLCLNMIVKNEAPVIERCILSVRPFIQHWVIVDTGSTDGTQDVVRTALGDLPGTLHERSWRDFAFNRSEALELAKPTADYVLIIDADDHLESGLDADAGSTLEHLESDAYDIEIMDRGVRYSRPQIVRSALPWRWRGVLHEFLDCPGETRRAQLKAIRMHRNHDGARRRDGETYRRDAAILEAALARETDPFMRSRYTFYLAQSYQDCGEKERALHYYAMRGDLGFWAEEVYVALYRAAQLKEQLGYPAHDVIAAYLAASCALPSRAEALHGASRFCLLTSRAAEGYRIARHALSIAPPASGLFVESWIYETGLLDELAVNAYWAGHYRESLEACLQLLRSGKLGTEETSRILANAQFALDKLAPCDSELSSGRSTLGTGIPAEVLATADA